MLKIEYEKKIQEVKNLENLEGAIEKQLENLDKRQVEMKEEMETKFDKIE